jgi:dephospho-CoA kinase
MIIAGLTGGIASGKSLVARIFKDLGAHVIDADKIVHELLEPDQPTWLEVIEYFGKDIQRPDSTIDRRKLGELVFNDDAKRTWLNSCIHPKVFHAFSAGVKHICERQPDAVVVFDAVLLFETGYNRNMGRTIVVYAEEEQQIERLAMRNNFTREHALARIRSQMPLAEKCGLADYVIDNTGSREHTEIQAKEIYNKLKQEAEKLSGNNQR